jgi:hypothetical protein
VVLPFDLVALSGKSLDWHTIDLNHECMSELFAMRSGRVPAVPAASDEAAGLYL